VTKIRQLFKANSKKLNSLLTTELRCGHKKCQAESKFDAIDIQTNFLTPLEELKHEKTNK